MISLQRFCGTLTVEFTGAEPEKSLYQLIASGIDISSIKKHSDLTFRFLVHSKNFETVSQILQKRGDSLKVVDRQKRYRSLYWITSRPLIIFSFMVLLFLTFYLPTRILFIETEGNQIIEDTKILEAGQHCGISFGASRKQIRSEKTKNELLARLPQLQWAGINTSGCRAVISVRERTESESAQKEQIISNLISEQDAFILSTTVTGGTVLVHPGDSVIAGQTLISGYTDNGFCIQATRATGEIIGLTNRTVTAAMPAKCLIVTGRKNTKYKISLLIRKKRINLWKDSRISDACCGRMYEEYYVSLPGGFQLPVAICIDQYIFYETEDFAVSENEVNAEMQQYSDSYLISQMVAGQILQKNQEIFAYDNLYQMNSNYTCTEMIGIEQREQLGDHNGKRY